MVLPHLQYCLLNWGNFKGDRNLGLRDRLLTLQKSLVRIICGASRISHADPLFAELATLKIDDLFTQAVRVFSYKLSKDMLPGAMASMVSKQSHNYSTRGARSNFFVCHSDGRSIRSIAPRYCVETARVVMGLFHGRCLFVRRHILLVLRRRLIKVARTRMLCCQDWTLIG